MDHSIPLTSSSTAQDGSPARVVGTLHRGALKEIEVDRLLNRQQNQPLHRGESEPDRRKASFGHDSRIPAGIVLTEPRPIRRRCASGERFSPVKLFDSEAFSPDQEELLLNHSATDAYFLKADLIRRRKTSPTRLNNDVSRREHESLMKSIRQRKSPRGSPTNAAGRRVPNRPRSRFVIPMDHPFKTIWDIMTIIFSIANAHAMHVSIRERKFGSNYFMMFCDLWFLLDILLNFFTERKTADGEILRDYRSIWARYLTSWFAVDALALVPWETLYVKPIIDLQNRRGILQKYFFRSRAVARVTRHLRGRHFRWFGTVAKHAKQHGIGANRLLRLIIKYAPKYFMFLRNMKGVIAVRVLRQIQWFRRFYHNILKADMEKSDAMTGSLTRDDLDELDDLSSKHSGRANNNKDPRVQVVYESWEMMDEDDDDGVPL